MTHEGGYKPLNRNGIESCCSNPNPNPDPKPNPNPNPSPKPNPGPNPNQDLAQWEDAIDLHEVRSNDVHAVLMRYGVEAARQTITTEISSVFGVYGIIVDHSNLTQTLAPSP